MSGSIFEDPTRRSFFKLTGVAVGGLALAACSGPTPSSAPPAPPQSGGQTAETPKAGVGNNGQVGAGRSGADGDTLFISGQQWGAPANFNTFAASVAWPCGANQSQYIYEAALRWNIVTGECMPGLCASYTVDGVNTVTLTMQDGVTFSDGTPCTAKDVAATFNLGKTQTGLNVASFFNDADSIEATDDKTVVVKVSQKTKNVMNILRMLCETNIVSQTQFGSVADILTEVITKPIGTGPFVLDSFDQTRIVLKRNDSYWGKTYYGGLPVFSQFIHPVFKDNDAANAQLQAGNVDVAQAFVSQLWKMWEGGKPVGTYLKQPPYFVPGSTPMLMMNTTKKGLDDPIVRKAIAMAVDYAAISETAMSGYSAAVQASLILPTGAESKWYNQADVDANGWKADSAGAATLLEGAGWTKGSDGVYEKGGVKLGPWKLITPTGWTDWNASCEIIAESLKKLGMDVTTNFPQQADCTQQIGGGTFDLAVWYVSGVTAASPWSRFTDVMSQDLMKPVGTTAFQNYGRWKNGEVQGLLDAAASATDDAARKAAYDQLDALFRKEVPAFPIMYRPDEFFEYNATNFYNFPDENNSYAPPMFRGAGNTWLFKLQKVAG